MRVLYLIHSTEHTGSTISFLNLITSMQMKGIEVVVVGPHPQKSFLSQLESSHIPYHTVHITESVYPHLESHSIRGCILYCLRIINLIRRKHKSRKDILKVARNVKPDVIHTNVGTIHEGFTVAKKIGLPHVWHIREYQDIGMPWSPFPYKKALISKLKRSNVIVISDGLLSFYGLRESLSARVIYNGIAHESQTFFEWPKDTSFLCASRISPEKGIDDVIRAFSLFYRHNPSYELVILGEGTQSYVNYLKDLSREMNCDQGIRWEGYHSNVLDYMKKATGLIVASHTEGFGRMTAEACFAGCIVIGRNCSATKEIIDYVGGLFFNTVEELSDNMLWLSKMSYEDYRCCALKAQERAVKLYSIERNTEEMFNYYNTININS